MVVAHTSLGCSSSITYKVYLSPEFILLLPKLLLPIRTCTLICSLHYLYYLSNCLTFSIAWLVMEIQPPCKDLESKHRAVESHWRSSNFVNIICGNPSKYKYHPTRKTETKKKKKKSFTCTIPYEVTGTHKRQWVSYHARLLPQPAYCQRFFYAILC